MGESALFSMNLRTAEFIMRNSHMGNRLHNIRTCHIHVGCILDHEDEIGEGRAVDGAARAGPHNAGYLRNNTAGQGVSPENITIGSEGIHPFLNPRAAGIIEPYDGGPHPHGVVHYLADFLGMGFTQ